MALTILFLIFNILILIYVIAAMIEPKFGNKNTICYLGNGTFQIKKVTDKSKESTTFSLVNVMTKEHIADKITSYKIDKKAKKIYTIGNNNTIQTYTVLNYKKKIYEQHTNLKEFDVKTQKMFEAKELFHDDIVRKDNFKKNRIKILGLQITKIFKHFVIGISTITISISIIILLCVIILIPIILQL